MSKPTGNLQELKTRLEAITGGQRAFSNFLIRYPLIEEVQTALEQRTRKLPLRFICLTLQYEATHFPGFTSSSGRPCPSGITFSVGSSSPDRDSPGWTEYFRLRNFSARCVRVREITSVLSWSRWHGDVCGFASEMLICGGQFAEIIRVVVVPGGLWRQMQLFASISWFGFKSIVNYREYIKNSLQ